MLRRASFMVCLLVCRALHAAPPYSCADLAQEANRLISLGEEGAQKELRRLVRTPEEERKQRNHVGYLCRILYLPGANAPLRPPEIGVLLPVVDTKAWPMYPVVQSGRTLFLLTEFGEIGGYPERMNDYLDYCRQNGTFRRAALPVPTRAKAINDLDAMRQSKAWKEVRWKQTTGGTSYVFDEGFVWSLMREQAERIGAK